MSIRHDHKQFVCSHPGCSKTFNRRDYLERHATNHLKVKPFVCVQCNRHFSRKDLYDNHLSTKRHARVTQEVQLSNYVTSNGEIRCPPAPDALHDPVPNMDLIPDLQADEFVGSPVESPFGTTNPTAIHHTESDPVRRYAQHEEPLAYTQNPLNQSAYMYEDETDLFNLVPETATSSLSSDVGVSLPAELVSSVSDRHSTLDEKSSSSGSVITNARLGYDLPSYDASVGLMGSAASAAQSGLAASSLLERLRKDMLENGHKLVDMRESWYDSAANSPAGLADADERFAWFFDNVFDTEKAKLGYDMCYNQMASECNARAAKYRQEHFIREPYPHHFDADLASARAALAYTTGDSTIPLEFPNMLRRLTTDRAEQVQFILGNIMLPSYKLREISRWIHMALIHLEPIPNVIHLPTFDVNMVHPALLVVLAILGMSLSKDTAEKMAAKQVFVNGFLYAYDALKRLRDDLVPSNLDAPTVNVLQAFGLLLRYERLVLLGDGNPEAFNKDTPGGYAGNLFFNKLSAVIPRVGPNTTASKSQPIWTTISSEGCVFHQGACREAQWRECVCLESVKRVASLAVYIDTAAMLSQPRTDLISVFWLDRHMIFPDSLWFARTSKEFFYITGETKVLPIAPYLGLLKSLIRFPRAAQKQVVPPVLDNSYSTFALKVISTGLIMIVRKFTGSFPSNDNDDNDEVATPYMNFDRNILRRLYRGLDVWFRLFVGAFGDLKPEVFIRRSMSLPLQDRSDPTQVDGVVSVPECAMVISLFHYASFIYVHEDLPIVHQVAANLEVWLDSSQSTSLQMLFDHLYMPLYKNWIKNDESKGLISTCALYLAWCHACGGQQFKAKSTFLSGMVYESAVVLWLHDSVSDSNEKWLPLRLDNFEFMGDAVEYLGALYAQLGDPAAPPPSKRGINAVLLLAACILYNSRGCNHLAKTLLRLLNIIDPTYTLDVLLAAVQASRGEYQQRAARAAAAISGASQPSLNQDGQSATELVQPQDADVLMDMSTPLIIN